MKNKNGFTLVELLAVIAILAILVIIALPNVMGMFNEAKKSSFTTELKEIYKVAQQQWMTDSMMNTNEQVYSRCKTCTGKSLELSGRQELDYFIKLDKSGSVVEYYATDGTYQFSYTGDLLATQIKDVEEVASLADDEKVEIKNNRVVKREPLPPSSDMLMAGNNSNATSNFLSTNIQKQKIEKIVFTNNLGSHTANGTDCWDVSRDSDGSVLAWVTDSDSNGKYEMTIGANGSVKASSGYYLFSNLRYLNSLNGINNFDTSNVTDMSYMFNGTGYSSTIFTLDLGSNFDTSKVTNMSNMFSHTGYSSTVFTLDLGDKFDTSNVTSMISMFEGTGYRSTVFTLDLGSNFDTSKVTNMNRMFSHTGYSSTAFTLDLGDKFNVSSSNNISYMFYYTGYSSTVFTLDLGDHFDTSNVTDMSYMFNGTGYSSTIFTLDLGSNFDTSKVTNMSNMFYYTGYNNTAFTLDLGSNFDTSNVTNMSYMFRDSRYLKTIYISNDFDISNVTNSNNMFSGCTSLVGGAGTVFNSSNITATYAHIDGGTSNPGYFTYKAPPVTLNNISNNLLNGASALLNKIDELTSKE